MMTYSKSYSICTACLATAVFLLIASNKVTSRVVTRRGVQEISNSQSILAAATWLTLVNDNGLNGTHHFHVQNVSEGDLVYRLGMRDGDELLTFNHHKLCVCSLNLSDIVEMIDDIEYFIPFEVCYARALTDEPDGPAEMDSAGEINKVERVRRTCMMAEIHLSAAPSDMSQAAHQRIEGFISMYEIIVKRYSCSTTRMQGILQAPSIPVNIQHQRLNQYRAPQLLCYWGGRLSACTDRMTWNQTSYIDMATLKQKLQFSVPNTDIAIQANETSVHLATTSEEGDPVDLSADSDDISVGSELEADESGRIYILKNRNIHRMNQVREFYDRNGQVITGEEPSEPDADTSSDAHDTNSSDTENESFAGRLFYRYNLSGPKQINTLESTLYPEHYITINDESEVILMARNASLFLEEEDYLQFHVLYAIWENPKGYYECPTGWD